jgi:cytochrome c-type biogenesis protein CcmH
MVWFWILAGLLTLGALLALLRPLIRQPQPDSAAAEPVPALYRRQLAGVDAELAQGRLTPEEAATVRSDITRRMLAAADRGDPETGSAAGRGAETSWRIGAAIGIAAMLPAAAIVVYFAVGTPSAVDRSAATDALPPHGAAELAAAAQRIKTHLQRAPGDLKGWVLLGRTLAALARFPEARDAYAHAIALAPSKTALHAELGEVLVIEAQGTVTQAAEAEFAKAPDDPRSRYYRADALLQAGDAAGARKQLRALLASAPADAPWRQAVAEQLAKLSPGGPPATGPGPAAAPAGPSAQDITAARSLSPEQRQAMIRSMVERLAQRLSRHPDDQAGWARLAHAYDVLGLPEKAQAARQHEAAAAAAPSAVPPASAARTNPQDAQGWIARAQELAGLGRAADSLAALKQGNAAFPGNLALLEAYLQALAGSADNNRPSPELVAVATQIHALDNNETNALWYLGLAAAETGDRFRAAGYWTRLLGALPPSDTRRALVQRQLAALH